MGRFFKKLISKLEPIQVGKVYYFEYHCEESEQSCDAELWHRTHQRVEVLEDITEDPVDEEQGIFGVYRVRFPDGFIGGAVGDELLDSPSEYSREDYQTKAI